MTGSGQKPWRPPPAQPARLGRYRLLAEIARGGVGAVHVGCADTPTGFRKIVALKTLRPDLAAEPALVRMLVEEAQLASRLHHPHIAQLYDLGDDGGPFLVMEYVHGESLSAVLTAGALPARIGVWIATCICDALAYAHALRDERGAELDLVHRDVSPQNILIDYDGVPRLLDFGIARARHRAGDTDRGVIKGRFAYMAPEQRTGRPVDGRADLHALGIVLYQAAVGAHPWDLVGAEVDRLPDPRPHRPGFSDALWAVIQRATAAEPVDRFATAGDMLAALREVAAGLGPPVDRREIAALLDGAFAARRAAKQLLLDGRTIDGDTEVLAPAAATPSVPAPAHGGSAVAEPAAERRPRRRKSPRRPATWRSWRTAALGAAALLAAILLVPGLALSRSWLQWPAASDALQRPCLLVETSGALVTRDAAWLAVRLVGLALDRHPTLQVMHGYRVQDREGWNPAGLAAAERACREAGADGVVVIGARSDGGARVTRNGQLLTKQITPGLVGMAEVAERLAARWAPPGAPPWHAILPDWPDGSLRPLLEMRERLVLQRPDRADRQRFEALARDNPQLEFVYLAEAIARWWNGDLDDRAARAAIPRPPGADHRTEVLITAIADLAGGHEATADAAVADLLEDARWATDPLTLYIAGEARIHAGRPAEGARLLERALAADPQLTPAIYHVVERRLAEGDWAGVERMAVLWDRVEPGSPRAIELRGAVLLGTGRYADASRCFESLLDRSRSDTASLHLPRAALIYARLLAGDSDGALARARVAWSRMADYPALTSVLPDPIVYGWALGRGDQALATEWEAQLRQRLADRTESANYWQLAYSLAILDHLAGRADARARWVGAGPSAAVSRRYRFAPHARMLAVLEASATGDRKALAEAAGDDRDLPVFHLARALLAQAGGGPADAVPELESAMASSPGGDFDCVAAALLVRAQTAAGDTTGAAATCRRILVPRVPRPYCLVARRDCLAGSPPP
jgi:tetratricopeptide (TPR) repeat protein